MRGKKLPSMMRCVLSITIVGLSCVSAAHAATEEVLHTFIGVTQRGANPQGSLIADAAGNLYGTTLRRAERMAMARSLRSLRAPRASGGKVSSIASKIVATALVRIRGWSSTLLEISLEVANLAPSSNCRHPPRDGP